MDLAMTSHYRTIADQIASDIARGRLASGHRLPPQRQFAFERGIAPSTASRVYAELTRRGLVTGEVGRGTYVRGSAGSISPLPLSEPSSAPVDLELVFPLRPEHAALLAIPLRALIDSPSFADALRPCGVASSSADQEAAALFLRRQSWAPEPDRVLFAAGGRQALAAALAGLTKPGDRIGVETLTYPVAKGIASRLGITLVPLAMDEYGLLPDTLAAAHRSHGLSAVYMQSSMHSPTGATMDNARREAIAGVLRSTGLLAVEDGIYSFLADHELPVAALAPEHVVYVESLSKRAAPGLTLGLIAAPRTMIGRLASALRSGAWLASGLSVAAGIKWMVDGTLGQITALKRADARARQAIAREVLSGIDLYGDERAYHLWLPMTEAWRGEAFASAALKLGIVVSPGCAFAVTPGHAPNGVRVALAAPEQSILVNALRTLRDLRDHGRPGEEID